MRGLAVAGLLGAAVVSVCVFWFLDGPPQLDVETTALDATGPTNELVPTRTAAQPVQPAEEAEAEPPEPPEPEIPPPAPPEEPPVVLTEAGKRALLDAALAVGANHDDPGRTPEPGGIARTAVAQWLEDFEAELQRVQKSPPPRPEFFERYPAGNRATLLASDRLRRRVRLAMAEHMEEIAAAMRSERASITVTRVPGSHSVGLASGWGVPHRGEDAFSEPFSLMLQKRGWNTRIRFDLDVLPEPVAAEIQRLWRAERDAVNARAEQR